MSFVVGALLFFVAVVDELVLVLSGERPTYVTAAEDRMRAAFQRGPGRPMELIEDRRAVAVHHAAAPRRARGIAMTLAIVGWIGMACFTGTPPGKNLFTAFWGSQRLLDLAPCRCSLDGRDPVPHQAVRGDVRGPLAWLNKVPGRLMHTPSSAADFGSRIGFRRRRPAPPSPK